jgi:hypothetical protein
MLGFDPLVFQKKKIFCLFFLKSKGGGSIELTTPKYITKRREINTNGGDQTKTPLRNT